MSRDCRTSYEMMSTWQKVVTPHNPELHVDDLMEVRINTLSGHFQYRAPSRGVLVTLLPQ